MIRKCNPEDFKRILQIINNAAEIYREIIPPEHWHNPYMTQENLAQEIAGGITFYGYQERGRLFGVMGIQPLDDVTLIRHAYVYAAKQQQGIGGTLLTYLYGLTSKPVLIGTWADAFWAIRFYQKYGFNLAPYDETMGLLYRYWKAPKWHMERSVVLADQRWFDLHHCDLSLSSMLP
jgi:GNAT superfamily N-acetyltransferase